MKRKIENKLLATLLSVSLLIPVLPIGEVPFSTEVKAAGHEISNPVTDSSGLTTWDCVYFGNYFQSDTTGTTKDPIKWRVLSVNGDDAFLLSEHVLDTRQVNEAYVSTTWESCDLRQWLNNDFYHAAFDSEEQNAIMDTTNVNEDNIAQGIDGGNDTTDKVYLLSLSEATNAGYGFSSDFENSDARISIYTSYALYQENIIKEEKGMSPDYSAGQGGWWWLRTPGAFSLNWTIVGYKGHINVGGIELYNFFGNVRPAIHLDLSSSLWSKAGTVDTNGDITGEVKPHISPKPSYPTSPTPTSAYTPSPTPGNLPSLSPSPTPVAKSTNSPGTGNNGGTSEPKVTKPKKVSITSLKSKTKKEVILSWKKVKGAKGYQIQYAANKKFDKKKTTTKTKLTIKKLQRKKIYFFRVRAYQLNDKKKVFGECSKIKKVRVK